MDFVLRENIERSNSSQQRSARKFQNIKQYKYMGDICADFEKKSG